MLHKIIPFNFLCLFSLFLCLYAKTEPLVSVIMGSFNRDLYLDIAIQCVLNQTYTNWELVIIDDGSNNPHTLRTLLHYQQLDPRIRVILQHTNAGFTAVLSRGFHESQG